MPQKFKAMEHSCVYEYSDEVSGNNYMFVMGKIHSFGDKYLWWGEAFKNGNSICCYSEKDYDIVYNFLVGACLNS